MDIEYLGKRIESTVNGTWEAQVFKCGEITHLFDAEEYEIQGGREWAERQLRAVHSDKLTKCGCEVCEEKASEIATKIAEAAKDADNKPKVKVCQNFIHIPEWQNKKINPMDILDGATATDLALTFKINELITAHNRSLK